jgi:succinate dehydrogenase / fumarate reductase cytochrome b subunit
VFASYADSLIGKIVWAGVSFSLMYHLFNGLRHLVWDLGHGFSMQGLYRGGWIVIGLTTLCTLLLWFFGFSAGGAA